RRAARDPPQRVHPPPGRDDGPAGLAACRAVRAHHATARAAGAPRAHAQFHIRRRGHGRLDVGDRARSDRASGADPADSHAGAHVDEGREGAPRDLSVGSQHPDRQDQGRSQQTPGDHDGRSGQCRTQPWKAGRHRARPRWLSMRQGFGDGRAPDGRFADERAGEKVESARLIVRGSCCKARNPREGGQVSLAWGFLGASALRWGAGEVVYSVDELLLGIAPFPSIADAGFLLAIPLAITGVLAFPAAPGRLTTRSQAVIDGSIVALSLVFISWALGLAQVYESSADDPFTKLIGAAYPVSDIVIIAVLLLVLRRAGAQQRGLMLLLIGG